MCTGGPQIGDGCDGFVTDVEISNFDSSESLINGDCENFSPGSRGGVVNGKGWCSNFNTSTGDSGLAWTPGNPNVIFGGGGGGKAGFAFGTGGLAAINAAINCSKSSIP